MDFCRDQNFYSTSVHYGDFYCILLIFLENFEEIQNLFTILEIMHAFSRFALFIVFIESGYFLGNILFLINWKKKVEWSKKCGVWKIS